MTKAYEELLSRAQMSLEEYELLDAQEAFQQALALMPDSAEIYVGLARAQLLGGEIDEAQASAEHAASLTEEKAEANALIASCHLQRGEWEEGYKLLKRTNTWFPDHPLVLSNLGKVLAHMGEYEKAREHVTRAMELGASKAEGEYDLGMISFGLEEFEACVDHFVAAVEANPSFLPPYFRLSQLAKALGLIEETIEIFENGLAMVPEIPELREELHVMYLLQSDPQKAMLQALELTAIRGWASDYLRVGNTALLLEDLEAAKIAYETAIEVDPDDVGGYLNLGHLHRLQHQREEALGHYRHVAELYPELYKPYLGLALLYMEIDKDFRKARLCLLKAVELESQDYDVLIHLAQCSLALEEHAEAETYARVALGIASTPRELERAEEILAALPSDEA